MSKLTYEQFEEVVKKDFVKYLPEEYKKFPIEIQSIKKVNQAKSAIIFNGMQEEIMKGNTPLAIFPVIYLEDMYSCYEEYGNLEEMFKHFAAFFKETSLADEIDFSDPKNHIILQLVNTEWNQEMLENIPHRQFMDLSIVYRWVLDAHGNKSAIVTTSLAESLKMDENDLYETALLNTMQFSMPCVNSMSDVIRELGGMDMGDADMCEISELVPMYVISNEEKQWGAASLVYDELLYKLATKMECDLFILPSSIHECIAIPAIGDILALRSMVYEVNQTQVSKEERLSDQVYYYDRENRKLSIAVPSESEEISESCYAS